MKALPPIIVMVRKPVLMDQAVPRAADAQEQGEGRDIRIRDLKYVPRLAGVKGEFLDLAQTPE